MLLSHFPVAFLHTQNGIPFSLHINIADLDDLYNNLRGIPWDDIFKLDVIFNL